MIESDDIKLAIFSAPISCKGNEFGALNQFKGNPLTPLADAISWGAVRSVYEASKEDSLTASPKSATSSPTPGADIWQTPEKVFRWIRHGPKVLIVAL